MKTEVLVKKRDSLRKAATHLRDHIQDYRWRSTARCNCGILAQVVLHKAPSALASMLAGFNNVTWSSLLHIADPNADLSGIRGERIPDICATTQLPVKSVVFALLNEGFTVNELRELEMLGNPAYTGGVEVAHDNPFHCMEYMTRWADALERQIKQRKVRAARRKTKKTGE
jgi:hypothetical protein